MEQGGINQELQSQIGLNQKLYLAYDSLPSYDLTDMKSMEERGNIKETLLLNRVNSLVESFSTTETCKQEVMRWFKELFIRGVNNNDEIYYERSLRVALDLSESNSPGLFNKNQAGKIEERLLQLKYLDIEGMKEKLHPPTIMIGVEEKKITVWKKEFLEIYRREPILKR